MKISINDCAAIIKETGMENTYMIRGEMGTGKSSILSSIAKQLPHHVPVMFDCAIASMGDLFLPYISDGMTKFAPSQRIFPTKDKPLLICLDEMGKAPTDVINALLPMLLERRLAEHPLPPGSIVFCTTNETGEGLGDNIPPHAVNRMGVLDMRKPSVSEWVEWAMDNAVAPEVIAWVEATPTCMESFENTNSVSDNPFIFHPERRQGEPFVSPRSLARASAPIKARGHISPAALSASLGGIIGEAATASMQTFLAVGSDLPSVASVVSDPKKTRIPKNGIASMVMAISLVQAIEEKNADPIAMYVGRMTREAQRIFLLRVKRSTKYQDLTTSSELSDLMSSQNA